jgi:hypothetical protein
MRSKKNGERPLFGQSWTADIIGVEMLEVELSWDFHGRLQARVTIGRLAKL